MAAVSLQLEGAAIQLLLDCLEVRPILWPGTPAFTHDIVERVGTFGRSRQSVALYDPFVGLQAAHG